MPNILIVDDNVDMLDTLEHLFRFYEFEVFRAENGQEALEVCKTVYPDIILLDALMPVMNGFETIKKLKQSTKTRDIPVIFLSANYVEDEHRVLGFELGADDYILKPFNAKELITRVKSVLNKKQIIEKLRRDNQSLAQAQQYSSKELDKLRKLAADLEKSKIIDPLTGLYNEQSFLKRLEEEFHRAVRYKQELSLVFVDVDLFQKINEVYGEQTGDYVLMKIANVILNNTRYSDIVFRLQRNRFAILLPNTDEAGAFYEAERVRSAVQQTSFFEQYFVELKNLSPRRKRKYQKITVSLGIVSLEASIKSPDELLKRAREALNKAKTKGRNQTVKYSKLDEA